MEPKQNLKYYPRRTKCMGNFGVISLFPLPNARKVEIRWRFFRDRGLRYPNTRSRIWNPSIEIHRGGPSPHRIRRLAYIPFVKDFPTSEFAPLRGKVFNYYEYLLL